MSNWLTTTSSRSIFLHTVWPLCWGEAQPRFWFPQLSAPNPPAVRGEQGCKRLGGSSSLPAPYVRRMDCAVRPKVAQSKCKFVFASSTDLEFVENPKCFLIISFWVFFFFFLICADTGVNCWWLHCRRIKAGGYRGSGAHGRMWTFTAKGGLGTCREDGSNSLKLWSSQERVCKKESNVLITQEGAEEY